MSDPSHRITQTPELTRSACVSAERFGENTLRGHSGVSIDLGPAASDSQREQQQQQPSRIRVALARHHCGPQPASQ
eukprot:525743-Rhodomonas_salina.1